MNPEWLRYYVALAETKNFHVAAERLYVTPQAISRALGILERQLGVRLVERDRRVQGLTGAGEALLEEARRLVAGHDNAERRLAEWRSPEPQGPVRIATIGLWHYYLLPPVLASLSKNYPRLVPRLYSLHPSDVEERVAAGDLDVGLLLAPPTRGGLACHEGPATSYVIASRPAPVAPWDAWGYVAARFFRRDEVIAADHWPEDRFPRRVVAEAEMLESIIRLAEAGMGAAYLPELAVRERIQRGTLAVVAEPPCHHEDRLYVISRRGVRPSPATREVLRALETIGPDFAPADATAAG